MPNPEMQSVYFTVLADWACQIVKKKKKREKKKKSNDKKFYPRKNVQALIGTRLRRKNLNLVLPAIYLRPCV